MQCSRLQFLLVDSAALLTLHHVGLLVSNYISGTLEANTLNGIEQFANGANTFVAILHVKERS